MVRFQWRVQHCSNQSRDIGGSKHDSICIGRRTHVGLASAKVKCSRLLQRGGDWLSCNYPRIRLCPTISSVDFRLCGGVVCPRCCQIETYFQIRRYIRYFCSARGRRNHWMYSYWSFCLKLSREIRWSCSNRVDGSLLDQSVVPISRSNGHCNLIIFCFLNST